MAQARHGMALARHWPGTALARQKAAMMKTTA
jgi:hypothetical protein